MLQDPGPDAAHDGAVLLSYLRQLMPPSTSQQMLHLIKVCLTAHATIPDLTNLLETWKACNCCHPVASSAANAQEHGSNHAQQPSSAKLPPSKAQQSARASQVDDTIAFDGALPEEPKAVMRKQKEIDGVKIPTYIAHALPRRGGYGGYGAPEEDVEEEVADAYRAGKIIPATQVGSFLEFTSSTKRKLVVLAKLGSGGWSDVFKVQDIQDGTTCAIKIATPYYLWLLKLNFALPYSKEKYSAESQSKFDMEANALQGARALSPYVVKCHDQGHVKSGEHQLPALLLELCVHSVDDAMKSIGPIPEALACKWMLQVRLVRFISDSRAVQALVQSITDVLTQPVAVLHVHIWQPNGTVNGFLRQPCISRSLHATSDSSLDRTSGFAA